jgi:hypothetical protein
VDISAYDGLISDPIQIITSDDFGVMNVHIVITNAERPMLESSNAIEVPAGTTVTVKVTARDRPGGAAISNNTKVV